MRYWCQRGSQMAHNVLHSNALGLVGWAIPHITGHHFLEGGVVGHELFPTSVTQVSSG